MLVLPCAVLFSGLMVGRAEPGKVNDPMGVLRKPIPDKLVVLTFDDGPASGYTVVAPILKSFGFNGSFYICDFDSFRTRKDWYLTWRQMKAMADQGFDIGNHTSGHAGGASIQYFLTMEDDMVANGVPKPVTIAWPVFQTNKDTYPDLTKNGYTFGRGGHFRPYRPTVDNPFDIPCLGAGTLEDFVKNVRQASGGRIVTLCYHGVPDIEHAACSLDPAVFKAQMQYLKDNNYKVISLRDLAEYIDPAKAAKLPPTSDDYKEDAHAPLASEEKPAGRVALPSASVASVPPSKETPKPTATETGTPQIPELEIPAGDSPITLDGPRAVTVPKEKSVVLTNVITGPGKLVKNGEGSLILGDVTNSYSGGTVLNGGVLSFHMANHCLGSGPVTVNEGTVLALSRVDGTNPLALNGGEIVAGDGFGCRWDADIVLNGQVLISVYNIFELNHKTGGISGPGGLTMAGNRGPWGGYVNEGRLVLHGTNTYTGPTLVRLGTLIIPKVAALYHADPARWTAANIRVHNTAALVLGAGGPDEFTGAQVDTLLRNLTASIDTNGLMGGSFFCIDTSNAKEPVVISTSIADSKGPGGGPFKLKKCGAGTVQLAGTNTYAGQTILEGGALKVASFNRYSGGTVNSSLGAPADIEAGEILMGRGDCDCALIYTGTGETSDRVMNLAGNEMSLTLDQSGTGLLKLTSPFLVSGHSASKTIVLKGDTAGTGEIAGAITNPHDRTGKATTSLTKTGTGTWTLSGTNNYTGPTKVTQGILSLMNASSLGDKTEINIAEGATLDLNFHGEMHVGTLCFEGKTQPAGTYDAKNSPNYIKGRGVLKH